MRFFLLFLSLFVFRVQAQDLNYLPSSTTAQVIKHTYYTLSYSEPNEQAEWVAYKLTKEMTVSKVKRNDCFRIDPTVRTGSATPQDYSKSKFDKGHLCPAADMLYSNIAMTESFFMSNMSPQRLQLNRGLWKSLEERVRYWAKIYSSLYVITGPVLKGIDTAIGVNQVSVPKYFYKVVLDYKGDQSKMIGFLMPNQKCPNPLKSYVVSVDYIEKQTGIDFFPALPDPLENRLESQINSAKWNFNTIPASTAK